MLIMILSFSLIAGCSNTDTVGTVQKTAPATESPEAVTALTTETSAIYTEPASATETSMEPSAPVATGDTSGFIYPPVNEVSGYLPSQNTANLLIFYVDFPDCLYDYAPSPDEIYEIAFGEEDESAPNYPFESMRAFYQRSSKGVMDLQGKVFRYTAQNNISSYYGNKASLLTECFSAFDESEDFSLFDGNSDGYIDAVLISVPKNADDSEWWPYTQSLPFYDYQADGMNVGNLITGNAQIESIEDYYAFNSTSLHEMGHCMGLPDYYLDNPDDTEGMHGTAGSELMDADCSTDFSAVSKLQLGWYRENQVQIYDSSQGSQTFSLFNAQKYSGNCVIIPFGETDSNYQSECFIIEYSTNQGNNSNPNWWQKTDSGIRIYHADTAVEKGWLVSTYRYANGSGFTASWDSFSSAESGRRFIRIIDDTDTDNFYRTGDIIDGSISGFHWYDDYGNETAETGIQITVGENSGDAYMITIENK